MVKRKSSRQKVQEKRGKDHRRRVRDGDDTAVDNGGAASVSGQYDEELVEAKIGDSRRLKRKVVKKMHFLERLQRTQQALTASKHAGKKKKRKPGQLLGNLSALADVLPDIPASLANKRTLLRMPKVVRSKKRQIIANDETKQMASVLAHPMFKTSPFAAVQQHLSNTLPPPPESIAPPRKKVSFNGKKNRRLKNQMDRVVASSPTSITEQMEL